MARLALGRIAVLQYVYPLTAILLDWAVYGRTLDAVQLAGVVLMALARLVLKTRHAADTATAPCSMAQAFEPHENSEVEHQHICLRA